MKSRLKGKMTNRTMPKVLSTRVNAATKNMDAKEILVVILINEYATTLMLIGTERPRPNEMLMRTNFRFSIITPERKLIAAVTNMTSLISARSR